MWEKNCLRIKVSKWKTVDVVAEMSERYRAIAASGDYEADPLDYDMFAASYAEVLRRMGKTEKKIGKALRKHPFLQYKNGEEKYCVL